jgi:4-hydroxythreonine-4-phosphate dehydrogenase
MRACQKEADASPSCRAKQHAPSEQDRISKENGMKPRIAMVLGDPAGIGPELIAKLLAEESHRCEADILLIADKSETEEGMRVAGRRFDYELIQSLENLNFHDAPLLYDFRGSAARPFLRKHASAAGGLYSLETLKIALDLTVAGKTDAILFAPLNKSSLHLGGMTCSDELHWFAEQIGYTGTVCEINVMDGIWTSRVTSHMALKDVPQFITRERVMEAIRLIDRALKQSGLERPRIAVCGFNPHCGDNGNFGREEIDVIAPAVAEAKAAGFAAEGPFPADTIFLKVQGNRHEYDAVVTMYHDQGQIAIKLMGFSRGVSVQGGLPIPITTPAHGTAFDIAAQGVANVGTTLQAFKMACRMGKTRRLSKSINQVAAS